MFHVWRATLPREPLLDSLAKRGALFFPNGLIAPLSIAIAYYAGAAVGFSLTPPGRAISSLWPPNAIVLAALLLTPVRLWYLALLAVLPAHFLIELKTGIPLLTALGWYVSNMTEALLGAACLRLCCTRLNVCPSRLFTTFRGVIYFVVIGVLLAPFVTTFLDAASVVSTGWGAGFSTLWRERFFSNVLSNLIMIPPIVLIGSSWQTIRLSTHRLIEAVLLAVAITLVVWDMFNTPHMPYALHALSLLLLLPLLLWATVRFGSGGVSISLLLVTLLSLWNAVHGLRLFGSQDVNISSLQTLLSVLCIPLLSLAAVLEEDRAAEGTLQHQTDLLGVVSQIASGFVNISSDEIDQEIEESLEHLRQFLRLDRVSLYERNPEDRLRLRYSAITQTAGPAPDVLCLYGIKRRIQRGERFLVADVSDLPPDSEEKRLFQVLGIRSVAIIPLGRGESLTGLLSLVSLSRRITWPASIVAQFEVLADIFYNALQRKEITRSLIESEQRFRFLADHSPLMVWMSDVHGQYTYVSRGWLELTGCTMESQLGEGWTTRIAPQDKAACLAAHNAAVHTRQRFEMEYRILRSDGEHRWIFSIGTPRYGDAGTFLGFIGSGVDITDRKNAENALMDFNRQLLQRQDAERRRIARDLHDDVVQQVALLAMDLAKSKYVSDSSQLRESIDRFMATTTGIAQSVRQISHTLHFAGIDLLPIADSLRGLCNDFAQRSEVNIRFTERGTVPDISEELKLCLYRVTQEALSNVAQHSHALSATVTLASVKDHLLLRIKDDGSGFACNQARPVSLGLTSVRERVHLSGGSLKIKSGSGRGTTILASFPISRKSNSESCEHVPARQHAD